MITDKVANVIVKTCQEIELRYEINFLEIGTDNNHVHFLVQSVPTYYATKIVRIINIIAREVFHQCPEVKKQLWGGEFWGKCFVNHERFLPIEA